MLQERLAANSWYKSTVQELFYETCVIRGDKTAICFEGKEISYRELQNNVHKCAQALIMLGVKKGDHVLTIPTPTLEFVTVYFATLQIGALINPLNILWGVIEFAGILKRNDPKVIVTVDKFATRDYIKLLHEAIPDLKFDKKSSTVSSGKIPTLTHLVSVSRQGEEYEGFIDFKDFMKMGGRYDGKDMAALVKEGKCTDVQFICQSSGSTGLSKGSLWDHHTPLAVAHFVIKSINFTEEDSYLNLTPLCHASGLFALNMVLAFSGTRLFLIESFDAQKAMELINRFKITSTFGFDAHVQAMKKVFDSGKYNFTIRKAPMALTPNTFDMLHNELCQTRDTAIHQLFGQSECGGLLCLTEPECVDYDIRRNANGRPFGGAQIVIKDIETGKKLPPHMLGEICYKSPHLFRGYYKQEEETKNQFDEEGYFHCGDYGTFEGGYLRFHGRLGGVVKTGGENVSTLWVTKNLLDLFADTFDDAQTIGVPDAYWGTKLVTWVLLKPEKKMLSTEEIRQTCKGKMAGYEIPKEFFPWEGPWPVSSVGKVDVRKLEEEMRRKLGI